MVTVETSVERSNGCSLVTAVVENDADRARTVRLRATGPVMPPRRRGVPERGWDGEDVTVRVPAGARRGIGFATATALDPEATPVELVDQSAAEVAQGATDRARSAPLDDPDAVVRHLGESRPPADAVPLAGEPVADDRTDAGRDPAPEREGADASAEWEWVGDGAPIERRAGDGTEPVEESADPVPRPVENWLSAVERRCARVERVTADAPLSTATAALDEAGGMTALAETPDALDAEAERLRALAVRAERLADRAETAALPRESLEALA